MGKLVGMIFYYRKGRRYTSIKLFLSLSKGRYVFCIKYCRTDRTKNGFLLLSFQFIPDFAKWCAASRSGKISAMICFVLCHSHFSHKLSAYHTSYSYVIHTFNSATRYHHYTSFFLVITVQLSLSTKLIAKKEKFENIIYMNHKTIDTKKRNVYSNCNSIVLSHHVTRILYKNKSIDRKSKNTNNYMKFYKKKRKIILEDKNECCSILNIRMMKNKT